LEDPLFSSVTMATATHLVKLRTDSDPFFAKAVWDKDQQEVEVLVLQKDTAWNIVLKKNDMDAVAKKLQMEESDMMKWMREAFTSGGSEKHHFTIYDGDNYLVWKRSSDSPESRMKLRLGSFPMTEAADSYAARMEFMNCATEAAKGKDEKDEALEIRLKEELRKCQEALRELTESKEDLETNLYEQFLPILQSKQDKIRQLKGMASIKKPDDEENYGSSTDVDEKMDT